MRNYQYMAAAMLALLCGGATASTASAGHPCCLPPPVKVVLCVDDPCDPCPAFPVTICVPACSDPAPCVSWRNGALAGSSKIHLRNSKAGLPSPSAPFPPA